GLASAAGFCSEKGAMPASTPVPEHNDTQPNTRHAAVVRNRRFTPLSTLPTPRAGPTSRRCARRVLPAERTLSPRRPVILSPKLLLAQNPACACLLRNYWQRARS